MNVPGNSRHKSCLQHHRHRGRGVLNRESPTVIKGCAPMIHKHTQTYTKRDRAEEISQEADDVASVIPLKPKNSYQKSAIRRENSDGYVASKDKYMGLGVMTQGRAMRARSISGLTVVCLLFSGITQSCAAFGRASGQFGPWCSRAVSQST